MTPQISIITPSLNQGAYLPHALASVAMQRGVKVEHLVFDPGSWDASRALLREWERCAASRCAVLERDDGPAHAINEGFARARGEMIGWLCSDDVYASDQSLAQAWAAFAANPDCDIVYGRASFIDQDGAYAGAGPFQLEAQKISQTFRAASPYLQPAAFFRRSLLDKIGVLDGRFALAFDVEFALRAACAGAKFVAIDAHIACKRVHSEAASQLLPANYTMECARATRNHLGKASPAWIARAIRADVAQVNISSARVAEAIERRLNRSEQSDRLVVLGNGPSLAGFDFEKLRGIDVIGMNAAYRHWRKINWYPRYYACLDTIVGLSHRDEIQALILEADALGMDAFLLRANLIETLPANVRNSPRVINFDELAADGGLMSVLPITTGSHAALFGALLGYSNLILLGVDCSYVETIAGAQAREGTVLELVEAPTHNPNYYFDDYQRAGDRYNVPNPMPDLHLECWRAAGALLLGRGVEVWNASAISRVDVFPKRSFARLQRQFSEAMS